MRRNCLFRRAPFNHEIFPTLHGAGAMELPLSSPRLTSLTAPATPKSNGLILFKRPYSNFPEPQLLH
uniref:Uncharacterized protein n=1 Tax=Utricularia reniformis TaxID=192314 RepID=A0A1Y0B1U1_9LAMI|nr:hypothetical protein AEK19_MT1128 [Utricularia reniformis]ART31344.1 hypothetical protein AEK19_MT1128 [Utricularia reniformis]